MVRRKIYVPAQHPRMPPARSNRSNVTSSLVSKKVQPGALGVEPRGELWARRKSRGLPEQSDRCTRSPEAQSPRVQRQPPRARYGSRAAVWAARQNPLNDPGSGTSPDRGSSSASPPTTCGAARWALQAQPALRSPWSPEAAARESPRCSVGDLPSAVKAVFRRTRP
jgi:hypothetical protein